MIFILHIFESGLTQQLIAVEVFLETTTCIKLHLQKLSNNWQGKHKWYECLMCVLTSDFDTVKIYVQFFRPINPESKKQRNNEPMYSTSFWGRYKLTVCPLPTGASLLGLP